MNLPQDAIQLSVMDGIARSLANGESGRVDLHDVVGNWELGAGNWEGGLWEEPKIATRAGMSDGG